jgi:hypothetical protein
MTLILLEVQSSVVLLNRSIKGQLERSATRFALSHVNQSRQCFYRMSAMKFCFDSSVLAAWAEAESMARESASVVIQSAVRRYITVVKARQMLECIPCNQSYPKIGSRWRIILFRQEEKATTIQKRFRGFLQRRNLGECHNAATQIQALYRRSCCRRDFLVALSSAIKLQSIVRMWSVTVMTTSMRTIGTTYRSAHLEHAATLIQISLRGYICRMRFRASIQAVRGIQAFWRRMFHFVNFRRMLSSAEKLQRWIRSIKRRSVDYLELAKVTEREVHLVEEAILSEMERKANDQLNLLLLKPRRARRTSVCVRRLAKRVKSLSQDYKENKIPKVGQALSPIHEDVQR